MRKWFCLVSLATEHGAVERARTFSVEIENNVGYDHHFVRGYFMDHVWMVDIDRKIMSRLMYEMTFVESSRIAKILYIQCLKILSTVKMKQLLNEIESNPFAMNQCLFLFADIFGD